VQKINVIKCDEPWVFKISLVVVCFLRNNRAVLCSSLLRTYGTSFTLLGFDRYRDRSCSLLAFQQDLVGVIIGQEICKRTQHKGERASSIQTSEDSSSAHRRTKLLSTRRGRQQSESAAQPIILRVADCSNSTSATTAAASSSNSYPLPAWQYLRT